MAFRYHKYKIIISIDFGTTFSGTCYTVTTQLTAREFRSAEYPKIIQVTSWPEQSASENKTPSINIYDRNFHLLHWGKAAKKHIERGELKADQIVKERFKLDLPSSVPQKGAIYKTTNGKKKEHDNMRATIDYFREIFDYTVSAIQSNIGFAKKVSVEKEGVRFVITVPAQWNDIQRAIMRTVAKEAGLITDKDHENRLLIINESSAATLHCEQTITDFGNMKPGNKYIICDAGGGTVDLATFEFVKRVESDPEYSFRRCQLTADSGDTCGSTFVDKKLLELLTRLCYNNEEPKDDEEKKQREQLFSPVIDRFIRLIKPVFGQRSRTFKFPKCNHAKALEKYKSESSDTYDYYDEISGEGDANDGQCPVCKVEDFRHLLKKDFGQPTILKLEDANIVPKLKFYLPDGVEVKVEGGTCTLTISYDIMRKLVFKDVVKSTIDLINRQIKKANGNINRTYLVGGFGGSPYLRKMIKKQFLVKGTKFPKTEFDTGKLIIDDIGNSAAMRGAMVYGIDGSRRAPQSDVVEKMFKYDQTDKYNTLICLDIGYNGTSCSYKDLENKSSEMIDIVEWPGLKKSNFLIPTAKETVEGKTLWGAQVAQTIDLEHEKLIVPSKLMAIVKADLRDYLCEYLKLVLSNVYQIIAKASPHLSNKNKYRYVITMENCYQFFNNKSQMRHIAQLAGIVSKDDPFERLLLISRGNASAMYNEKKYFSEKPGYTSHFLQIYMYHDTCHLSLYESTKISGTDMDAEDDKDTGLFRNVRSMRSATFDFDFISKIVSNLNNYISTNVCIKCSGSHNTYNPTYYAELRKGFLTYIKAKLNFNKNDETQNIPITDSGCCIAYIKVYDLLEHVFRPAVKHLASEINRFATQNDMAQRFTFDKIFLSGVLLKTNKTNYDFLERIIVNNISEFMNIQSDFIKPSEDNGKEALLGAALYGNQPTDFTERVSRTTYAVKVSAFKLKEFSDDEKKAIEEEKTKVIKDARKGTATDLKKRIYALESAFGLADLDKPVNLFYQAPHNPSFNNLERKPETPTFFIHRGDKILEKDQIKGISKKFYAHEDCIVYATVYSSDSANLNREDIELDDTFRKIHQFEIYVKRDHDDPMTAGKDPRLHFEVRFIPDNNEAKFEAKASARLGKKIPEFRFRDEFLVANIYDDLQYTEIGDLTINEEETAQLAVRK